jgi:hypothetical protein
MLITKILEVNLTSKNINNFENKGYYIPREKDKSGRNSVKIGTKLSINVEDLPNNSGQLVMVKCDGENCLTPIINPIRWVDYKKHIREDDKYYCHKCAINNFVTKNMLETVLKNTKSFEQWCIENNKEDILARWDYNLNNYKPCDVCFGSTSKRYWFTCPKGIHISELKNLGNFVGGQEGSIMCNQCNSFAQWGIDNLGEDFLEKFWDYDRNIINPYNISYSSNKKVWIKCQEKDYHESYDICCNDFIANRRCPYCKSLRIHEFDSLGALLENLKLLNVWSNKNLKSPLVYAKSASAIVWWKCNNNKHEDYYRSINTSNVCNFNCPSCGFSKGEKKLEDLFDKNNIKFDSQTKFHNLLGLGKGQLSYDFYLPKYNLFVEYQGVQHEKYIKGFHKSKKDFERQIEHDRRKKEYALQNGYQFLEIWYYDFDKIEEILLSNLSKNKY